MKKKFTILIAAIAAILMMALPKMVAAQDPSASFTVTGLSSVPSSFTSSPTGFTMSVAANGGTNPAQNNGSLRLYAKNQMTIASSNGTTKIKSVTLDMKINASSQKYPGISAPSGSFEPSSVTTSTTTITWTAAGDGVTTITFTFPQHSNGVGGNWTFSGVSLTYSSGGGGGGTTYTVTYNANDGSQTPATFAHTGQQAGTYAVLANDPESNENPSFTYTGHTFNCWNTLANGTGTSYDPEDEEHNHFDLSGAVTLYAKWAINTHNITMPSNDAYGSYSASETNPVSYGTTVTLTYTPASSYSTYSANWSVNGTPIDGDSFSMPDEDVTVTVSVTNRVTDVLNRELTGVSSGSTNYTSWSNKTSNSEAVYAGKTAGSNNSIQMNASSGNGIITTTSGGKVKSISVEWESHTQNGRYITIYGSENALTLSTITSGTSLGTIKCGTNTSITVNGNYNHIGIVANNALYLSAINITWQPSSVANPSFSPAAGTYTTAQDVAISCETTGAAIYYTIDGTTPTSSSTLYTTAIHVTEPTTIKAIAIKDDESSSVVSATYNIVTPLTTMDEILARAIEIGSETTEDVYVALNNWVVTGVGGYSNRNAYVTDNEGKGFIVYNNSHGFAVNDKLNGTVKAALQLYNGSSEFTTLTTNTDNISVSDDGTVTVYTKTIDQLSAINTGSIVTIKDLAYDGDNYVLTNGTNTIIPYTTLWDGASFTNGKKYHVTGLFVQNGDDKRINPRSAADIVLAADMSATDFSGLTTFTYVVNHGPSAAQTIGVLCGDLGTNNLRATASSDFEVSLTGNANDYHEYVDMVPENGDVMSDLYVRLKAGLTTDAHNGTLTFTATNLTTVEQALTGTVSATVTYDIIVDDNIANGSIESDKDVAEEGETVTLTAHPDQYYQLGAWVTEPDNLTWTSANQFTMPDDIVLVSATFTRIQYTITYSVNENTSTIPAGTFNAGEVANLPTATVAGQTFIGWSTSASSTEVVKNYIPTENTTLYAVFGDLIEGDLTITKDTKNFPTSYGSANTFTEYTLEGKKFKIQQAYVNQGKLQWRAYGNSNGTGTIYNTEDFGIITSIVLVYNSSDNNKNFTIKAGTVENPTEGTSITPTTSDLTYTFDLSDGTYHYFVMANGENAGYLDQIVINYEVSNLFTEVTNVTTNETIDDDIAETERVVVASGATLIFNGENNGTAANLVIEDGGQLICSNPVAATVKKNITNASAKAGEKWYAISSSVHDDGETFETIDNVTNLTSGTYDMFCYDEPSNTWLNQKPSTTPSAAGFSTMMRGRGYIYRNTADKELAFTGQTNFGTVEYGDEYNYYLGWSCKEESLKGFNLVGNPYPHKIYKGVAFATTSGTTTDTLVTGYYALEGDGSWTAKTNSDAIDVNQAILVEATEYANGKNLQFKDRTTAPNAKSNNDNIMFTVENSAYSDIAYAWFDNGNGLKKIEHRNANIPMLYINQDGTDYAIAMMSDNTKSFGLNFKAKTMGTYTLSYKAEGNFDYLHIIDRLTGEDVDMLMDGKYSFVGSPQDNAGRFIVKLGYDNGSSTGSETFVYQNGNDIIVDGEGTLEVFDVTGRKVMTTDINGVETINGLNTGVYIFRVIGETLRTQKIVVR